MNSHMRKMSKALRQLEALYLVECPPAKLLHLKEVKLRNELLRLRGVSGVAMLTRPRSAQLVKLVVVP
jgi:hypothetical protein